MCSITTGSFDEARANLSFGEVTLEELCQQYPKLVPYFRELSAWGWRSAIDHLRLLERDQQDYILNRREA